MLCLVMQSALSLQVWMVISASHWMLRNFKNFSSWWQLDSYRNPIHFSHWLLTDNSSLNVLHTSFICSHALGHLSLKLIRKQKDSMSLRVCCPKQHSLTWTCWKLTVLPYHWSHNWTLRSGWYLPSSAQEETRKRLISSAVLNLRSWLSSVSQIMHGPSAWVALICAALMLSSTLLQHLCREELNPQSWNNSV